ncbi:MAG: hypothetical protein KKA84_07760 [Bacteroidetes bacterium]|nr:hypothetical protein [Bacteroidota bacterium]
MELITSQIVPSFSDVLRRQGVPEQATIKEAIRLDFYSALEIFQSSAKPQYLAEEISKEIFDEIFNASGLNEEENPLQSIYSAADQIALFVITVGGVVTEKIKECMTKNEIVIASMMDTIASLAVENSVGLLEDYFAEKWNSREEETVLGYSPGYCGWHLAGQTEIFRILKPEKIDVHLSDSFLMEPIKSVSGVIIKGPKEIHLFRNNFQFCSTCVDHTCVSRMKNLKK